MFHDQKTWGVAYSHIWAVLSTQKKAENCIKKRPKSYKYDNFSIRRYPIGYAVGSEIKEYKEDSERGREMSIPACPNKGCCGSVDRFHLLNDKGRVFGSWVGRVHCDWCGMSGPTGHGKEEAVELWNALPR